MVSVYDEFKDVINNHRQKIQLFKWALMSSTMSLIYSEYVRRFRQRQTPTRMIQVPEIKTINEILSEDGILSNMIVDRLIDEIINDKVFLEFIDAEELILFNDKYIDILRTILEFYIMPSIFHKIPKLIEDKFSLHDQRNRLYVEVNDIDLFNRNPINDKQFSYIVQETILNLLLTMPTINKECKTPEDNMNFEMMSNEVLTVGHDNSICPIHFNSDIINNDEIMKLLSFVTSTNFEIKNRDLIYISSSSFNQIAITSFHGIMK